MSAAHLMLTLHRAGFRLSVDGDNLNIDGSMDQLDEATKASIRTHKAKLIGYCTPSPTHEISRRMAKLQLGMEERQDIIEQFNERAGICEHDGNMPRHEAEQVALDEAMSRIGMEGGGQ